MKYFCDMQLLNYNWMMYYYKVMRGVRRMTDLGPKQLRWYLEKLAILNQAPKFAQKEVESIGDVKVEHIRVPETREETVLFVIHGGAFAFGSARTHRNFVSH
ncbi:MAG: hypothetical protein HKN32_03110, partial [Flavobacteriales bacterium]|nr:hypothetical protein [Flavobacteriales bacterium]